MWVFFAVICAFFHGFYDISKKASLNGNAVFPVLFLNTLFCFAIAFTVVHLSKFLPVEIQQKYLAVTPMDAHTHLLLATKAAITLIPWCL